MATPVLKIAADGYDVRTAAEVNLTLNSELVLPKLCAGVKLTPTVPEGYISGSVQHSHGLTYPPMFLYYRQFHYLGDWEGSGQEFTPNRFFLSHQGGFFDMDSTEFRSVGYGAGLLDSYLMVFLDPLADPATDPSPTTINGPRLKISDNVDTDADFRNRIDSKYQSLKVHMKGQMVNSLPAFNAAAYPETTCQQYYWFTLAHNLGYPPVFTPFVGDIGISLDLGFDGSIPSDFIVNDINDTMAERWVYEFGWSTDYLESLWICVDSTNYYVGIRRLNFTGVPYTFPARTIRVNYVIFNNPINEEFNLLD